MYYMGCGTEVKMTATPIEERRHIWRKFKACKNLDAYNDTAVYRVALIQPRGRSLVVTHRTADVQVTPDIPVTIGLVPVENSSSISGSHAAMYVVNTCVS